MWDSNSDPFKDVKNVDIPKDYDIFSLVMPDDLKDKYKKEQEEKDASEIETVVGGMQKLVVSETFDKYIPNNDWYQFFYDEMQQDYFKEIENKYNESLKEHLVYPKKNKIFRAFKLTPISDIKVIIIGQDPYPGKCKKTNKPYANGLAFSVNKECSIPASLKNMYKEMKRTGFKVPKTGELEGWARQGVFLINTQLSVEAGNPNSHKFWNDFTDRVIEHIVARKGKKVFVLMGGNALKKYKLISKNKDNISIITSHPSPLGYKRKLQMFPAFYESNIFVKINKKLRDFDLTEISW